MKSTVTRVGLDETSYGSYSSEAIITVIIVRALMADISSSNFPKPGTVGTYTY